MKYPALALAASFLSIAAVASPAQAQTRSAYASASITQIKIELIDLDPADGIAPWIDIHSDTQWAGALRGDPDRFDSIETAGQVGFTNVQGSVSAITGTGDLSAAAKVHSSRPFQSYSGFSGRRIEFTLSPGAALHLTAVGMLDGGGDADAETEPYFSFSAGLKNGHGEYEQLSGYSYTHSVNGNGSWNLAAMLDSGAVARHGYFDAMAGAATWIDTPWSGEGPAPVPEPSTWAMLLAGAGLIGVAVRRKQRG